MAPCNKAFPGRSTNSSSTPLRAAHMNVARKARVQCTFVSDRSLSKHLHAQVKESNFTLLEAYVIDVVRGSYFGVYGKI